MSAIVDGVTKERSDQGTPGTTVPNNTTAWEVTNTDPDNHRIHFDHLGALRVAESSMHGDL